MIPERFLPRSAHIPLKEGRSHPYQPLSRQRRRTATVRFIIAVVALSALGTFASLRFLPWHGVQDVQDVQDVSVLKKAQDAVTAVHSVTEKAMETVPENIAIPSSIEPTAEPIPSKGLGAAQHQPSVKPAAETMVETVAVAPQEAIPVQPSPSDDHDVEIKDRPGFEAALERVLSLLPDEIHVRELLRPFEGTGKEKLREIGLRVRAFKTFFDAWEKLHLVSKDGDTYIRDDVIPYLRGHDEDQQNDSPRAGAQTIRTYEAYRYFLQRLSSLLFPWTMPYFADHMTLHASFKNGGRGIVLTAGDDQAPYLLTSIPSFRQLGCNLPIEIMYLGDSDLAEDYRAELEMLPGVITRDIAQMVKDEGWRLAGWAAKPFAILLSSFREVIFVDADALFFRNPELLFSEPSYVKTGALFFRDRLFMPESKKRWLQQVLPKPISKQVRQSRMWTGESGHMQESGVLVVDKWRHFVALLLVTRMNGPDRDGKSEEGIIGIYDMVYGDKETFWIGWELVGDLDYAFHQGDAGIMGVIQENRNPPPSKQKDDTPEPKDPENPTSPEANSDSDSDPEPEPEAPNSNSNSTICDPQLLHLDTAGSPLWFNGWLWNNKFADRKKKEGGRFDAYMREPREVGEPSAWQLEENNRCCLTAVEVYEFTQAEREVLEMIVQIAKDVGAYGGNG